MLFKNIIKYAKMQNHVVIELNLFTQYHEKDNTDSVHGDYNYCDSLILEQNKEWEKAGAGKCVCITYLE